MASPVQRSSSSHKKSSGSPHNSTLTPTPPPGKRPESASKRTTRSHSRPGSVSSRNSVTDVFSPLSRQNSLISPTTNGLCYEDLPEVTKPITTIGRYHTIVPPITSASNANSRPTSRSNTVMSDMNIDYHRNTDEDIIHTVSEENNPGTPRLKNPTASVEPQTEIEPFSPPQPKPEPTESEPRLRIAIKLPHGSRIDRCFRPTDTILDVLDFVSNHMQQNLRGFALRFAGHLYEDTTKTLERADIKDRTMFYLESPEP